SPRQDQLAVGDGEGCRDRVDEIPADLVRPRLVTEFQPLERESGLRVQQIGACVHGGNVVRGDGGGPGAGAGGECLGAEVNWFGDEGAVTADLNRVAAPGTPDCIGQGVMLARFDVLAAQKHEPAALRRGRSSPELTGVLEPLWIRWRLLPAFVGGT